MAEEKVDLAQLVQKSWGGGEMAVASAPKPGRPSLRLQYWRKCTRPGCPTHTDRDSGKNPEFGWISTGPTLQGDPYRHAEFQTVKHMEPLPQYGSSDIGTGPGSELMNPITRFTKILESPGGLDEFPKEQIQAYGWDKIKEIRELRPDVVIDRIPCKYGCPGREFLTEEDRMAHQKVMHSDVVGPEAAARGVQEAIKLMVGEKREGFSEEELKQIAIVAAAAVMKAEEEKAAKK